jgi:hypothetical protein
VKYLCLVYAAEQHFDAMTGPEIDAMQAETRAYDRDLARSGHLILAQALQSTRTATTVRVRQGHVSVTDGPFAETKEQLCGFVFVEAADLDEALQIAARCPLARFGSVEVRPILELGPAA